MTYQPAIPLWPEQEEALRRMQGREAFALFMAMRTGKTPVTLADFGRLEAEGQVKDLMILAPAGVYKTWQVAMQEHFAKDLLSRINIYVWKSGTPKTDKKLKEFLASAGPRALIMNIEALSRPGVGRDLAAFFLRDGLRNGHKYLAVDESTTIKNKTKRTRFVVDRLSPFAKYRRILSGLPTPRSPLDLFHQFMFLDPRILRFSNYFTFMKWAAHTELRDFGGRILTTIINKEKGENGFRPECISELRQRIDPHSYFLEFRPKVPSTYSIREVELTEQQRQLYDELKEYATAQLDETTHVTATVVIAQIIRLHQIVLGHVVDETGGRHSIDENRTQALLEELEDYGGKAVIWFAYVGDLERCMKLLEKEYGPGSTARFYGGNAGDREEDERRFKTDSKCRFMGATAGAGGRGRTWDNADRVIYHSSTDDLEKRDQSEQRAHSRNKEVGVDYVDLICRGTVEEKIIHSLRNKINMVSTINGTNYREWLV